MAEKSLVDRQVEVRWTYCPGTVDLVVGGRGYGGLARDYGSRQDMLLNFLRRGLAFSLWCEKRDRYEDQAGRP